MRSRTRSEVSAKAPLNAPVNARFGVTGRSLTRAAGRAGGDDCDDGKAARVMAPGAGAPALAGVMAEDAACGVGGRGLGGVGASGAV